jgi:hypothetical protein
MAHEHGAYLGGIRSVECIRQRCVMDEETGCWHMRSAHGRALPKGTGKVQRIWIYGRGAVSLVRAVWELDKGHPMQAGRRGARICDSHDCANPAHIRALRESEAMSLIVGRRSPRRDEQLRRLQHARRKFTSEQVCEIRASDASSYVLARELGVSPTTITSIRRGRSYRDWMAV